MKKRFFKIIFMIMTALFLSGCVFKKTPEQIIATKCRLKLPIKKEQCVAVGIHPSRVMGGRMEGLPVTAMKQAELLCVKVNDKTTARLINSRHSTFNSCQ